VNVHGLELDGYVAFVVSRNPKRLAARVSAIKMQQHILCGKPMENMNQRWVAMAEVEQASLQSRGAIWLAYAYWFDREEFERAALVLEKLLRSSRACSLLKLQSSQRFSEKDRKPGCGRSAPKDFVCKTLCIAAATPALLGLTRISIGRYRKLNSPAARPTTHPTETPDGVLNEVGTSGSQSWKQTVPAQKWLFRDRVNRYLFAASSRILFQAFFTCRAWVFV
jgi:hypothetical protein